MPFDECSPEDTLSEFGAAGRSGRMEESDQIICISFQKYKHRSLMELCITLIRCNQICIEGMYLEWKDLSE